MAEPVPGWSNTTDTGKYDGFDSPPIDMRVPGWSNRLRSVAAIAGSPGAWSASLPYASLVQQDGASAYWRLDEPSGTTVTSKVGGYIGTISGGVTLNQPGALADANAAMTFNPAGAADGGITVPDGPYKAIGTGSGTLECWFRATTWLSDPVLLETNSPFSNVPRFVLAGGTTPYLFCRAGDAVVGVSVATPLPDYGMPYMDGRWHHLVGVLRRGSPNDTVELWIDSRLIASGSMPSGANITSATPFQIARHGVINEWTGGLDEIGIYQVALTPAQIAAHYIASTMPVGAARETLTDMNGVTAIPTTAWTTGQYVELLDATHAHWSGAAWVAGNA